jgi:hypothetical protein
MCKRVSTAVIGLKKALEDEARNPFNSTDLFIFTQHGMARATNSFDKSGFTAEGTLGMMVMILLIYSNFYLSSFYFIFDELDQIL